MSTDLYAGGTEGLYGSASIDILSGGIEVLFNLVEGYFVGSSGEESISGTESTDVITGGIEYVVAFTPVYDIISSGIEVLFGYSAYEVDLELQALLPAMAAR